MGERMNPLGAGDLRRLGAHVSGSLESARTSSDAAARVRARLANGEGRRAPSAPAARVRIRPRVFVGALATAAAVLLVVLGGWQKQHAALTFVVGAPGTPGAPSESGVVGAFLAAPPSAELPIAFSDGTKVAIAPGARARIAEVTPRGARVLVESGVVHANVIHRADTSWRIDAGPFEVKVTGTRFDVAWQPTEQAVVVTLHEGSVVVTGCGLADGQRVSAGQQLHASCKTGTSTVGPLAAAAKAPEPAITAATSLPDAPPEPPAAATAAPSAMAIATASPSAAASANTAAAATMTAAASASAATSAAAASSASAADLLARATADRYAGRLDSATESLDAVRRRFPGSESASTAAFELGRIAFDGRHDFATAADWFDTYLRERPYGTLAREALGRALEARHRAGNTARARELARRYLSLYPDGPHASLALRLTPPEETR